MLNITYHNLKAGSPDPARIQAFQTQIWPQLQTVYNRDHLAELLAIAQDFQSRFSDVLILGTGGSSLGAKTLSALSSQKKPTLHFLDNVDPETFERLFQKLKSETTGILIVSKSGTTAETLMQALTLKAVWGEKIYQNTVMITEPTTNTLRGLGESWGVKILAHPQDIGGRFSCFSCVGLLPAAIAGLDLHAILDGAQTVLENHLAEAVISSQLIAEINLPNHIVMPYCDRLLSFAFWWKQLWAESLGKEGKGFTPVEALGTVDQHSQLQLFLEGPRDKLFTIITTSLRHQGWKVSGIPLFEGKTMGDLLAAEQEATIETLARHNCPLRVMHLETLTEKTLGALMMYFMIETIMTADLIQVNAFDQPAVEEGKELTRRILSS